LVENIQEDEKEEKENLTKHEKNVEENLEDDEKKDNINYLSISRILKVKYNVFISI